MDSIKNYNIDFVKLKLGQEHFDFQIEDSFFGLKENALIEHGNVNVHLLIDKKERLMNLDFTIEGIVSTECDVCLDVFNLPIQGNESIVIKIVDEPKESDGEIIYLGPNEISFNVYDIIYEVICINVPMTKACEDNAGKPKLCNPDMLNFLSKSNSETNNLDSQTNPIWDKLKNIKD